MPGERNQKSELDDIGREARRKWRMAVFYRDIYMLKIVFKQLIIEIL